MGRSVIVKRERADRELRRVVKRILPLVPTVRNIAKAEFEAVHAEILACVHEKTGASPERLGQLKDKVLADLPNEYGRLPKSERTWPAVISYLYSKYLRELRGAPGEADNC
jgi:hypothetical protein